MCNQWFISYNIHSGYEKLLQNSVLTSAWFASKSHTQILGTDKLSRMCTLPHRQYANIV